MHNSMKPLTDLRASPRHSAFSLSLAPSPPPKQPQLKPFSAGSYRVQQKNRQRASSPQVSSIIHRERLFLTWTSAIPHIREPKLQDESDKEEKKYWMWKNGAGRGLVSFDLINLSEIPKHFLWHLKANFCVCFMKRA